MQRKQAAALLFTMTLAAGSIAGCGQEEETAVEAKPAESAKPFEMTIATPQVGEAPKADGEVELAIEKYTNTKLDIQWIPPAAFEDKKNIMIASNEMPKAFKLTYNATTLSAIQSGLFWDITDYLKDYKNLAAENPTYYNNIKIDGKLYGLPLYRDIGRAGIIYRKDWYDALDLKTPSTLDDWYNIMKAIAEKDPDKNGQADTYAVFLDKSYNGATDSGALMTRLAVPQGAPNKWGVVDGKVTPEFMTQPYVDVLKMFRKLYAEKAINQDFSVIQRADSQAKFNAGKAAIHNAPASAGASSIDNMLKSVPAGVGDIEPYLGPNGIRVPAESGNNGFYVFPKSSVKTEAELRQVLTFFDKMLDAEMSTLLTRGIEGKHFAKTTNNKVKMTDLALFNVEVKPFRDSLPSFEVGGKGLQAELTPLQEKGWKIVADNLPHVVPNVALTFTSDTYTEKGAELDILIGDAQTKYIMGKIDDAGWQAEVENWKKAGGDKIIADYTAQYNAQSKK
ncbi:MAG: transporter substrate-binding protein [Paenibacillaceae bacterium]|jgi:putative aldouronate transport system substrate-binding protein|nr:transporter substrate-binding protein [Paenibacillaceae bacterium]